MRRNLPTPMEEGRHRRPVLDRRNVLSRLLCDPRHMPEIIRRTLGTDILGELTDPFGFRGISGETD